jgi:hypothetical protein
MTAAPNGTLLTMLKGYWSHSGTSFFAIGMRFATAGFSFLSGLAVVALFNPARVGIFLSFISLAGLSALADLGLSYSLLLATATRANDDSDNIAITSLIITTPTVIITGIVLYLAGFYFLQHGAAHTQWETPWLTYCMVSSLQQLLMLLVTHAEGSGNRHAAWRANFTFEVVAGSVTLLFVILGFELWGFSAACIARVLLILLFFTNEFGLFWRARHFRLVELSRWRHELWPMQWRMLSNNATGILMTRLMTPMILTLEGARQAGRIGLILALGTVISSATIAWPLSQSAVFAHLLHENMYDRFRAMFHRTFVTSTALALFLAIIAIAVCTAMKLASAQLSDHLPTLSTMFLIIATIPLAHIAATLAIGLRCQRRDPVVILNVVLAVPSIIAMYFAARASAVAFATCYFGISILFLFLYACFFTRFVSNINLRKLTYN